MTRDETLSVLSQFKRNYAQQYGILEIGVFGSVGRIDIVRMREKMNPFLKGRIEKEAHYV